MNLIELVRAALWTLGTYLLLGVAFAALFFPSGLVRMDPGVRGAGLGFRMLILPGVAALWPLLAWRWWRTVGNRDAVPVSSERPAMPGQLRRAHGVVWILLAAAGPVILAVALAWRPAPPPTSPLPAAVFRSESTTESGFLR